MTKIGLIIDFDNTLVRTSEFIKRHLESTCQKLSINYPGNESVEAILKTNPPFEKIFSELFADHDQQVLAAYRSTAQETTYQSHTGSIELLNYVHSINGYSILVTNRLNLIDLRLTQAGISSNLLLAKITPSIPKPDKNAYFSAIEILIGRGIDLNNIFFVGDSLDDAKAVPDKQINNFFAVTTGFDTQGDFLSLGLPSHQIKNSLIEILAEFQNRFTVITSNLSKNPYNNKPRNKTIALCGGEYGDEGKGKMTDAYVDRFAKSGPVIVYRDNGGANAGHTIEFSNGQRVILHQLPSGVFCPQATVILGKGMVIHPGDLIEEIEQVRIAANGQIPSKIIIDEMAVLSLDTHRAFESVLKTWEDGGKGSTARGISPAYADVLLRHPLRVRDLTDFNLEKITRHYQLYDALIKGLGGDLSTTEVASFSGKVKVGNHQEFIDNLYYRRSKLFNFIKNSLPILQKAWSDENYGFVFEKAMGVGLDYRWGVYPDVTASDTTFANIFNSTEGVIDPNLIEKRALVLKGTYMSSVGSRKIPTIMPEELAIKIRADFGEMGATTGRSRDIAFVDLPALKFFTHVSRANYLIQTHLDAVYSEIPIKICVRYEIDGHEVDYRPDQEFLNKVTPIYTEMPSWDRRGVVSATKYDQLPQASKDFLNFICQQVNLPLLAVTTGPRRDQWIECDIIQ